MASRGWKGLKSNYPTLPCPNKLLPLDVRSNPTSSPAWIDLIFTTFSPVVSLKAVMFFFNHVTCCIVLSSPNHSIRQVTGTANHFRIERNTTGFSVIKGDSIFTPAVL